MEQAPATVAVDLGGVVTGEGLLAADVEVGVVGIRWHWHRWGRWGDPYVTGGLVGAFSGGTLRQRRSCIRCGRVQDRICVVPK